MRQRRHRCPGYGPTSHLSAASITGSSHTSRPGTLDCPLCMVLKLFTLGKNTPTPTCQGAVLGNAASIFNVDDEGRSSENSCSMTVYVYLRKTSGDHGQLQEPTLYSVRCLNPRPAGENIFAFLHSHAVEKCLNHSAVPCPKR